MPEEGKSMFFPPSARILIQRKYIEIFIYVTEFSVVSRISAALRVLTTGKLKVRTLIVISKPKLTRSQITSRPSSPPKAVEENHIDKVQKPCPALVE